MSSVRRERASDLWGYRRVVRGLSEEGEQGKTTAFVMGMFISDLELSTCLCCFRARPQGRGSSGPSPPPPGALGHPGGRRPSAAPLWPLLLKYFACFSHNFGLIKTPDVFGQPRFPLIF